MLVSLVWILSLAKGKVESRTSTINLFPSLVVMRSESEAAVFFPAP